MNESKEYQNMQKFIFNTTNETLDNMEAKLDKKLERINWKLNRLSKEIVIALNKLEKGINRN